MRGRTPGRSLLLLSAAALALLLLGLPQQRNEVAGAETEAVDSSASGQALGERDGATEQPVEGYPDDDEVDWRNEAEDEQLSTAGGQQQPESETQVAAETFESSGEDARLQQHHAPSDDARSGGGRRRSHVVHLQEQTRRPQRPGASEASPPPQQVAGGASEQAAGTEHTEQVYGLQHQDDAEDTEEVAEMEEASIPEAESGAVAGVAATPEAPQQPPPQTAPQTPLAQTVQNGSVGTNDQQQPQDGGRAAGGESATQQQQQPESSQERQQEPAMAAAAGATQQQQQQQRQPSAEAAVTDPRQGRCTEEELAALTMHFADENACPAFGCIDSESSKYLELIEKAYGDAYSPSEASALAGVFAACHCRCPVMRCEMEYVSENGSEACKEATREFCLLSNDKFSDKCSAVARQLPKVYDIDADPHAFKSPCQVCETDVDVDIAETATSAGLGEPHPAASGASPVGCLSAMAFAGILVTLILP